MATIGIGMVIVVPKLLEQSKYILRPFVRRYPNLSDSIGQMVLSQHYMSIFPNHTYKFCKCRTNVFIVD